MPEFTAEELKGVPSSVIAANELAEKLQRGEPIVAPGNTPPPATPAPAPTPEPIPAPVIPAPAPEPVVITPAPADDWEQKYKVLQGKYNAEVPRLHTEVSALKNQIVDMSHAPVPATAATPSPVPELDVIAKLQDNPKVQWLKTEYPNVYEAVTEYVGEVKHAADEKINRLESEVHTVKATTIKSSTDRFYDTLESKVKDWDSIQHSQEFRGWASERDRYTGKTRGALLTEAYQRLDADTVSNFFEDYSRSQQPLTPSPVPSPSSVPHVPIAPPASVGHPAPQLETPPPEIIKGSEINRFYQDCQRGRFQGTSAEQAAFEARYAKATAEGRVDPRS